MSAEHPAAEGHYEGWWFGWCERCLKWRLRVYRWFRDGGGRW